MSVNQKIAHNTIIQIAGKALSTFLGLIALGMMTRYLGTEQFGWYITTISFLQFVGILIDFGLTPVTAQMMSAPDVDKSTLFKNLLGFRLTSAIIFLGIAPLIALFFPYPLPVKIAISFSTLSFLGTAMNQVLVGFYQTKLKMHIPVIGELAGRVVLVVGIWFLIQQRSSFIPVMVVIMLSSVVYTVVLWLAARKETPAGIAFDWQVWKNIMATMWPVAISIIFNVVYLKGDTVILSLYRSQIEVGVYGAAYRVIDILAQMAMMLMGVVLPLLAFHWSRNSKDEFRKHYQQAFDAMMLLGVPMMVGLIMLGNNIMAFVAGREFIVAGRPLQILAIAVFGVYVGAVFGHTAVAINKQKQTMWIYISDAVITLIGYLIFIPRFGMYGAAWMTVFSELYAGILLWFTIRKYTNEKLRLGTVGKVLAAVIPMAGGLYLFRDLHVLISVVIGMGIYIAMLFSFGAISKTTLKEILTLR